MGKDTVEAWFETEDILGAIERAYAELSASSGVDDEQLKAAFTLGAMALWNAIILGRRRRRATHPMNRERSKKATIRAMDLLKAAAEYKLRHPRASTRSVGDNLARDGWGKSGDSVRERLRLLRKKP